MSRQPNYDIEAMKLGVLQCDKNIKTFAEAIAKENETKRWYEQIIKDLEEKLKNPPPTKISVDVNKTT